MPVSYTHLHGVGGVDQPAYLLGILEVGAEIGPVGTPGLGDFRVFLVPALPKGCLLYTSRMRTAALPLSVQTSVCAPPAAYT